MVHESSGPLNGGPFKICPYCEKVWHSREMFLTDRSVRLIGYQVNFENLEQGMFLFVHHAPSCGTTLSIPAGAFMDLVRGPIVGPRLTGTEKCPGFCLRWDCLDPCPTSCECAYVRRVLQILKSRYRTEPASSGE